MKSKRIGKKKIKNTRKHRLLKKFDNEYQYSRMDNLYYTHEDDISLNPIPMQYDRCFCGHV
jgi:hypothetical protein